MSIIPVASARSVSVNVLVPMATLLLGCIPIIGCSGGASNGPHTSHTAVSFIDSGQDLGTAISWNVSLGDADGDNDLDLVVANSGFGTSKVWLNTTGEG